MKRFLQITKALIELLVNISKGDKDSQIELTFTGEIIEAVNKPRLEGKLEFSDPIMGALGGAIAKKSLEMWGNALGVTWDRNKTLKVHIHIKGGEILKEEITYTPGENDEKEDEPAKEAKEPVKES